MVLRFWLYTFYGLFQLLGDLPAIAARRIRRVFTVEGVLRATSYTIYRGPDGLWPAGSLVLLCCWRVGWRTSFFLFARFRSGPALPSRPTSSWTGVFALFLSSLLMYNSTYATLAALWLILAFNGVSPIGRHRDHAQVMYLLSGWAASDVQPTRDLSTPMLFSATLPTSLPLAKRLTASAATASWTPATARSSSTTPASATTARFQRDVPPNRHPDEKGAAMFREMVGRIKAAGQGKPFDCIMGMSGGSTAPTCCTWRCRIRPAPAGVPTSTAAGTPTSRSTTSRCWSTSSGWTSTPR